VFASLPKILVFYLAPFGWSDSVYMNSATSSSEPTRAPSKIRRKSHRKSRNGCARCKRRRIKVRCVSLAILGRIATKTRQCDETKPACTKCVDFGIACDYNTSTPLSGNPSLERSKFFNTQGPPAPRQRGRPRTIWSDEVPNSAPAEDQSLSLRNTQRFFPDTEDKIEDFRLLNHFITRTNECTDLTASKNARDPLHDQALLLSFAYPCILDLILEFSALELAYQQSSKQEHYHVLAERHSTQGLKGATALLSQFNESYYHAAYTAATFACINYFARGPQPGEYLLFSASGPSQWLPLLRGIRTIIDLVGIEKIAEGPTGKLPQSTTTKAEQPAVVMLKCPNLDWTGHFEHLHAFVASCAHSAVDTHALSKLQWCYEATYGRDGLFKGEANHQNVFTWPYQLGEDFVYHMQTLQPVALIIVAHFALLLQNYEFIWYIVGWSDHIIAGVLRVIDETYHGWLRWPIEQARKIRQEKNAKKRVREGVASNAPMLDCSN
jgi:hypothetical protein